MVSLPAPNPKAFMTQTHSITHSLLPVFDKSGQEYCFNCAVEEHQTRAYNLASYMLGDWALAEDATQEAFLSAFRAFKGFRGQNLAAWLMRIVANTCRDMLRAKKSRPSQPLDSLPSDPEDPVASSTASPESQTLSSELREAIHKGLETLAEDQRLAIVLIDIEGFSYEEASQAMDTSLGTVKSRLSRGRAALRDYLRTQRELLPPSFRQER